ncbi:MAG TPA: VPLPA-CTERM-specific exosortase XrtD [Humidesulfovibrio sp.]|uniref:VPLPA-CTERM-specific exosortase XrtD n=1 Tax=Humidesulfovibrio sp. TaxID=2910988 RepID=UPI002BE2FE17|nr:VPLPA-CTERM-specific exosortase XrtD [Humidesulfovibrio sp.]HWR04299.1 VPLPA-CTERM-specific exosortase XrtD [Humidesulfovibrio sp.]
MIVSTPAQRYTQTLSLLLMLAGCGFMFRNDIAMMAAQWVQEDFSYCLLVPLVAGYAVWQRRRELAASQGGARWPGFAGIAFAGLLFLMGHLGTLEPLMYLSLWLCALSIAIVCLGMKALRLLLFPALLLLFIIPPPAFIERTLSFQLRLISSDLSTRLLQALSVPVFLEGNVIDLGTMKLQVVDACSGLRYFLPTIFLSLVVGHMFNRSIVSRVLLVLLSAPVSIVLNAVRITVTGLLVRYVSPTLADGFFHDFQGWLIYLATLVLLLGASRILRFFESREPAAQPVQPEQAGIAENAETAEDASAEPAWPGLSVRHGLGVFALFVCLSLAFTAFLQVQTVPRWNSLDTFPLELGEWQGTRGYLDQATLDSLWSDDYFLASYRNRTTGSSLSLFIPYYKLQTAQHTAHAPTSCMLGSGWEIASRRQLAANPAGGRAFAIQQMVLMKNGEKLVSNFWFQQRGRIIASEFQNKFYLLWDSLTLHRSDGALVRVEMGLPGDRALDDAQLELDAFSGRVSRALDAHIPNQTGNILP